MSLRCSCEAVATFSCEMPELRVQKSQALPETVFRVAPMKPRKTPKMSCVSRCGDAAFFRQGNNVFTRRNESCLCWILQENHTRGDIHIYVYIYIHTYEAPHTQIYIYTRFVILCYLSVTGRLIAKVSIADLNNNQ
jgi:hypothetical protein